MKIDIVPGRGLEPLRISPPDPKSGASANFATLASPTAFCQHAGSILVSQEFKCFHTVLVKNPFDRCSSASQRLLCVNDTHSEALTYITSITCISNDSEDGAVSLDGPVLDPNDAVAESVCENCYFPAMSLSM